MNKRTVSWQECDFDAGWGVVRGKTCTVGDGDCDEGLRILGLHGWLDNANTFDNLVPLLPVGVTVMSIDLPGHGLSDHLSPGAHYDPMTFIANIRLILKKLGWRRFVFLAHGSGCITANYYAAMFQDAVAAVIHLDNVTPRQPFGMEYEFLRKTAIDTIEKVEVSVKKPKPVYSRQAAIQRLINAQRTGPQNDQPNIDEASAAILLERSARLVDGGYTWNHDRRVYDEFHDLYGHDNWLHVISGIKCPVLLVRASRGFRFPAQKKYYQEALAAYQTSSSLFDCRLVDGAHHVHLTQPERVAECVGDFLQQVGLQNISTISKL